MTSVEQQEKALLAASRISALRAANQPSSRKIFERLVLPDDNDVPFSTIVLDHSIAYPRYLPPEGASSIRKYFYRYSIRCAMFHRDELLRYKKIKPVFPLFNMINISMFHQVHRRNEFIKRKRTYNPGQQHVLLNPIDGIKPAKPYPRTYIGRTPEGRPKIVPYDQQDVDREYALSEMQAQKGEVETHEVGDGFVAIRLAADELYRRKQHLKYLQKQDEILNDAKHLVPQHMMKHLEYDLQNRPEPTDSELQSLDDEIRYLKEFHRPKIKLD